MHIRAGVAARRQGDDRHNEAEHKPKTFHADFPRFCAPAENPPARFTPRFIAVCRAEENAEMSLAPALRRLL
jgi:hypothetical protein